MELSGIRVIKYVVDYNNFATGLVGNDLALARYADVLLMKAEALLRNNRSAEALMLVNELRLKRGASEWSDLTLSALLDERSRELFWEAHRRLDLLRFGRYLDEWQQKPADTDNRALLFPIPLSQIGNQNYQQNPLY
ncbi:RagB/SusD domain-containing protein [Sphingobacterium deserti]|uniref:RagB/SusD domain-containing protein n=2 Tax=Sphingobacterium deserti TaxID=1229276 RepID=A0A0B8SZ65_9SPHI|nr:RagB/SusD domain-containing protein [Sphingobacterium deserti]